MSKRHVIGVAAALVLLGAVGGALACGGDPMPVNLVARPSVKATLRRTYLAAHPGLTAAVVTGPLRGRTYYGTVMGDWYAVADFAVAGHETRPVVLERHSNGHGSWHVVRETRGAICGRYVPVPLIMAWHLRPVHQPDCFREP